MGWPRDAQGTQRPNFSSTEAESAEDRLLPSREQGSDPAQATGHLERCHVELGAGSGPTAQNLIGQVVCHGRMVAQINA